MIFQDRVAHIVSMTDKCSYVANIKLNGGTGSWELEGFEGKEPGISKRALNICKNTFAKMLQ